MAKDPICGMYVQEGEQALKADSRGSTFYFCSMACLNEFVAPQKELARLRQLVALGAVLSVPILLLTYLEPLPASFGNWVILLLALPVQFVVGARFYRGAYHALRAKTSNMDVLVATGTTAAFGFSAFETVFPGVFGASGVYFDTAAVIITLILLGKLLEYASKERASATVRSLMGLKPTTVRVLEGGVAREVPIEELREGQVFEVKPGERVATDGEVVEGETEVDESMMTGESRLVDKAAGSEVIGGSVNSTGRVAVRATKVGRDTVLEQMVKLVEEAQAGRAPIQRLADRVAEFFVPAVLAIAVGSSLLWWAVGIQPQVAVLVFVSVVIIACPCALGIATPAALLVGTSNAAKRGILVKGGEAIEAAAKIDTVVFDKTGTLTEGKQKVVGVLGDATEWALGAAAALESRSEHGIGAAIVREAAAKGLGGRSVEGFRAVPGQGVMGTVDGEEVKVGKAEFAGVERSSPLWDPAEEMRKAGATIAFVSAKGAQGAIALADSPRADAGEAVRKLREMGVTPVMLTGDDELTARAVAKLVGIDEVYAGVLPAGKEEVVERLQEEGRVVAMVGDGVNDAPALARADLGIAIGSGTDVAKETGGVVLLKSRPLDVAKTIWVGRSTLRKIKENLFWAFGYNAALIPVAAGILIPFYGAGIYSFLPFLAGAAMAVSSATVVSNSLLLSRAGDLPGMRASHGK